MVNNKTIGFIGIDNYDYILYLTKVLSVLGNKVLVIDYSCSHSLTCCIPHPKGMESDKEMIEYIGFDFTRKSFSPEWKTKYNFIFIFFGLYNLKKYDMCDSIILTSDYQRHHLVAMRNLDLLKEQILQIVLKDNEDIITEKHALSLLEKQDFENVIMLYHDVRESKNKYDLQNYLFPKFKNVSKDTKQYIANTIKAINSTISDVEIKKAYKTMDRG